MQEESEAAASSANPKDALEDDLSTLGKTVNATSEESEVKQVSSKSLNEKQEDEIPIVDLTEDTDNEMDAVSTQEATPLLKVPLKSEPVEPSIDSSVEHQCRSKDDFSTPNETSNGTNGVEKNESQEPAKKEVINC